VRRTRTSVPNATSSAGRPLARTTSNASRSRAAGGKSGEVPWNAPGWAFSAGGACGAGRCEPARQGSASSRRPQSRASPSSAPRRRTRSRSAPPTSGDARPPAVPSVSDDRARARIAANAPAGEPGRTSAGLAAVSRTVTTPAACARAVPPRLGRGPTGISAGGRGAWSARGDEPGPRERPRPGPAGRPADAPSAAVEAGLAAAHRASTLPPSNRGFRWWAGGRADGAGWQASSRWL
jgi:hypothetical protein